VELDKEALFYIKQDDGCMHCFLCPHNCKINPDGTGICGTRKHYNGKLHAVTYGKLSALNFDPIEKKPLYHFFPGKIIFSVGSVGCNLQCSFCQNCDISQSQAEGYRNYRYLDPEDLLNVAATQPDNIGIAFTYNEPSIWYEYVLETGMRAKETQFSTAMISNGYISQEPLDVLLHYIDAFNIDLKAFSDTFYKKQTSSELEPVLKTLKKIRTAGKHLEITNLIIPGLNDDVQQFKMMINWIKNELGPQTILHLSRYHPTYKLHIAPTPEDTLYQLFDIANENLDYVYIGNIGGEKGRDTHCPSCNYPVIKRFGHVVDVSLTNDGNCNSCGVHLFDHV